MSNTNTLPATGKPKRYHPLLVTLHWLIAILMFSTILLRPEEEHRGRPDSGGGFPPPNGFQPGNFPPPQDNTPPAGFTPRAPSIDIHMVLGAAILILMVARLIVRWRTQHPEWATAGNPILDKIGELTHIGLYGLTFAILLAGIYLAYQGGLIASVLGMGAATITQGFRGGGFFIGALHGLSWNLLFLLLFLHVGAALYHQFILKDNLLGRMWYGKKNE